MQNCRPAVLVSPVVVPAGGVGDEPQEGTNNPTERLTGLTLKTRVRTMRGPSRSGRCYSVRAL